MKHISEEEFKKALRDAVDHDADKIHFFDDFKTSASGVPPANLAAGKSDAQDPKMDVRRTRMRRRKKIATIVSVACALLLVMTFILADPAKLFFTAKEEASEESTTEVVDLTIVDAGENYENLWENISSTDDVYADAPAPEGISSDESYTGSKDMMEVPPAYAPPPSEPSLDAAETTDTARGGTDSSKTNNQTEGVEEADIIKTDGTYIYTLNSEALHIVKANEGNPEKIASIPQIATTNEEGELTLNQEKYFEMFITQDRLILISEGMREPIVEDTVGDLIIDPVMSSGRQDQTRVDIYDISDRANPKYLNRLAQDGTYVSSRMIGDDLYLISNTRYYGYAHSAEDFGGFVPVYEEDGKYSFADSRDILMISGKDKAESSSSYYSYYYSGFTMISGINVRNQGSFVSKKAIYGLSGTVYSSLDHIYLASDPIYSSNYDYNTSVADTARPPGSGRRISNVSTSYTTLLKMSASKGKVDFVGAVQLEGYINNQFSMDEYKGVFRIVMTSDRYIYRNRSGILRWFGSGSSSRHEQSSALYTFDKKLKKLGVIENIAPDEEVYSARFMGDVAYVVTFRRTDPLFSIDLSNPKAPKILGQLKIPGFSDYLHPYGTDLLFGIGRDADEKTGIAGNVKLSMFDISDKSNVTEEDVSILNNISYTQVSDNHKAILIDSERDLIAFPAGANYYICSYAEGKGFKLEKTIGLNQAADSYYRYQVEIRGLFIGDYFYVVSPNTIVAFDMTEDYEQAGSLTIGASAENAKRFTYWMEGVIE
ncbi:MAG: beta-propeller domain-containing protein [Clostridiales Family XIII bacterium]|jgi:uncharacterized secreted protein with C-terminal beta-propeller domain|nr:beta-propeller domain-containing protein [Clostridiales Family XIII bacterium]